MISADHQSLKCMRVLLALSPKIIQRTLLKRPPVPGRYQSNTKVCFQYQAIRTQFLVPTGLVRRSLRRRCAFATRGID
eukprot:361941-Chlamydomonas_euryale.AAC.1